MKLFNIRSLWLTVTMLTVMGATLASCDSVIYDEQGDCSVRYHVSFKYSKNQLDVDAFSKQVKSVSLFVFNRNGELVLSKTEAGEQLAREGYTMNVDVLPGRYDLIAWCGLSEGDAFSLAGGDHPVSKNDLICRLNRTVTPEGAVCTTPLNALFHGSLENVDFPDTYGDPVIGPVELTKNTNNVRIILQHYNGKELNKDDFSFTITDNNGLMDYTNALLDDEVITYYACRKESGEASIPQKTRETVTSISSVIAEINVGRLMIDHNPVLAINCKDKSEPVLRLPLIDLLMYAKGDVPVAKNDQDYLDRQDSYNLIFFVNDENGWYMNRGIWINSWHVILQNSDL